MGEDETKNMRESCPSTLGKKSRYLQDGNCLGIRDLLADKSKFNLRMSRSPAYPEKKSTITNILKLYTSSFRMWIGSSNFNPTCNITLFSLSITSTRVDGTVVVVFFSVFSKRLIPLYHIYSKCRVRISHWNTVISFHGPTFALKLGQHTEKTHLWNQLFGSLNSICDSSGFDGSNHKTVQEKVCILWNTLMRMASQSVWRELFDLTKHSASFRRCIKMRIFTATWNFCILTIQVNLNRNKR